MKLARMAHVQAGQPQRKLIISRTRGYHGVAYGGTSALGIAAYKENFGPFVDEVVQVPARRRRGHRHADEPARQRGRGHHDRAGAGCRRRASRRRTATCSRCASCATSTARTSCSTRSSPGSAAPAVGSPPTTTACTPDFATFAKAVTSGYIPLGGVFVGVAPTAALESDPDFFLFHGFTYSGHPTACAAGLKNLEIIRREGLVERAKHIDDRLGGGLQALAADGVIDTFVASAACGPSAFDPTRMPRRCATTCSTRAA